jgi:ABC-type Na+ transport system ATPase subunit NatA
VGTLHRSSLLLDEERSGMNAWVVKALQDSLDTTTANAKYFKNVNIVEVDNVCDHGLDILALLKKRAALL